MNLDGARAGEGVVVGNSKKNKNVEMGQEEQQKPALFESRDIPLDISIPEGWRTDQSDNAKRME